MRSVSQVSQAKDRGEPAELTAGFLCVESWIESIEKNTAVCPTRKCRREDGRVARGEDARAEVEPGGVGGVGALEGRGHGRRRLEVAALAQDVVAVGLARGVQEPDRVLAL